MHVKYYNLNEVPTRLLLWNDPFHSDAKEVVICVTGNPGVPDFYEEFGYALNGYTGLPMCVIGHSGHDDISQSDGPESLYDLDGQLKHKLALINLIDKNTKLHLIGHSVGAWMITEIMQIDKTLHNRVASVNLLFPTLQKMAMSNNGWSLNNLIRKIHYILLIFVYFIGIVPNIFRDWLINLYLVVNSLPKYNNGRISKVVNPYVLQKILTLAYHEMDNIVELNVDSLNEIKHLTNVIYSDHDGWVPLSYIEDLKQFQPEIKLKETKICHSFVLRSSELVAQLVYENIKPSLNKQS